MVLPRFSAPLSMSGADRVGSMSKRSCRRHETRLQQLSHALLALVAIAKLAGPPMSKNSLSSEEFALLIKNSRKRSRVSRLRVLMSARTYTVKSFFNVPGWAKALYYETSQATSVSLTTLWPRLLSQAGRYWRRVLSTPSAPTSSPLLPESLNLSHYSVSRLERDELVEPLTLTRLSIPPPGHKPVPLMELLEWPWTEIFSEEGFKVLYSPVGASVVPCVPSFSLFESPSARGEIYSALHGRHMMEFMPIRTSRVLDARGVANGLFGLNKSPTKQRLLFDGRRGNASLRPMSAVQRCYEDVLASDPVRACGLRAKAFNLFSPSSLAHLPPDVGTHVGSDLSDFFHFIEVPPWMRAHQHLEPELAVNLGLDPRVVGLWVEPVLTTLGMGFCYATLIAQLVHERLLVPSLSRVMRLRKPLHVSPAHSEAFETAAAEADDDGLVLISNVPPSLLAGCLAHLSPPEMDQSVDASMLDWRVPLSCLAYEAAQPEDSADHCVEIRGFDLRDGDLACNVAAERRLHPERVLFTYMLYIDDHHDFALKCPEDSEHCLVPSLTDWRLLASLWLCACRGFLVQNRKLFWSGQAAQPCLGYDVDLSGPVPAVRLRSDKMELLVRKTRELLSKVNSGAMELVQVGLLQHVVGGWVWAMMVRREFLCVLDYVFKLTAGKDSNRRVYLSTRACDELQMAADLAPLMEARLLPLADTLTALDACSTGYGVAYRREVAPEVMTEFSSLIERHGNWSSFSTDADGCAAGLRLTGRPQPEVAHLAADCLRADWGGECEWSIARMGLWSNPEALHINVGEATTARMAVRWMASQPAHSLDRRVIFIGDNQASLGALSKGRSSVPALNRVCRSVCALVVSAGFVASWVWVRSSSNPSDYPSRLPALQRKLA